MSIEFNVGTIKEQTKVSTSISFKPKSKIDSISPSCGCMTCRYDLKAGKLFLTYSAGLLDNRTIEAQGFQAIHKFVTVKYLDGTSQKINVTGKIIQK